MTTLGAASAVDHGAFDERPAPLRQYARAVDLYDFMEQTDPEPDFVIPDLLARPERLILTGPEGGGKSTLVRQMGLLSAAGIHPFTGEPMTPIRVLLVDLENSRQQLRAKAGPVIQGLPPHGRMTVVSEQHGLDLSLAEDRIYLRGLVRNARPDLLLIGPMYRLQGDDPMDEMVARTASRVLDDLRLDGEGCALVMEAHTPHTPANARKIMRPYGASLWKRWPEFGLFLDADLEDPAAYAPLTPWRGGRDERDWPRLLHRSGNNTWVPPEFGAAPKTLSVLDKIATHLQDVPEGASQNALASVLGVRKQDIGGAVIEGIHRGILARASKNSPVRLAPEPLDAGGSQTPSRQDPPGTSSQAPGTTGNHP